MSFLDSNNGVAAGSSGIEPSAIAENSSATLGLLVWLTQIGRNGSLSRSTIAGVWGSEQPVRKFGRFRLEGLLGTGSYGAVFRAFDPDLGCPVALKIAWPAILLDPETSRRFVEEPQSIAAISHPGIVRVYESGSVDMARYISFELIEGPTLAEWLSSQERIPVAIAAQVIFQVAESVEFMHRRGVVHRDLKPSNILLRPVVGGHEEFAFQPVVTDFGLASRSQVSGLLDATASIAVIGTDRYMSPEQAAGQASEAGPASDLFSLGVILYEMVAGVRPFDGENGEQVRTKIQTEDPPSIRGWRRNVPRDIETITLKCLEKSPQKRYLSANALAEDLQRFLAHEPIVAHPISAWVRAWKFMRRRPLAVSLSSTAILAAVVVAAVLGTVTADRRAAIKLAKAAQQTAQQTEVMERQHRYAGAIRSAARSLQFGNCKETLHHLRDAQELARTYSSPGMEWNLIANLADSADHVLTTNMEEVRSVRFSPQKNVLACAGKDRVCLWDVATWNPSGTFHSSDGAVCCMEFSSDGMLLAIGNANGRVTVCRFSDGKVIFDREVFTAPVVCIAWIGDTTLLSAAGGEAQIATMDAVAGEVAVSEPLVASPVRRNLQPRAKNRIVALKYLPERKHIAVLKEPSEVLLFDPGTLTQVDTWDVPTSRTCMCYVPQGSYVAIGGASRLQLYSANNGEPLADIAFTQAITRMEYCPAQQLLVCGFMDGSVQSWTLPSLLAQDSQPSHSFSGHRSWINSITISSDGAWLATGARENEVLVWRNPEFGPHPGRLMANEPGWPQFSPCGRWLVMAERKADGEGYVAMYAVESGRRLWTAPQPRWMYPESAREKIYPLWQSEFVASGDMVVVREPDKKISLRDSETGRIIRRLQVGDFTNTFFATLPNGREMFATSTRGSEIVSLADGAIQERLPNRESLRMLRTRTGVVWYRRNAEGHHSLHASPTSSAYRSLGQMSQELVGVAISADGRYFAGSDYMQNVHLWDLSQEAPPGRLMAADRITEITFSADNQSLICLGDSGTATFWHIPSRSEVLTIGSREDKIVHLAVHPHETMLALTVKRKDQHYLRTYRLGERGKQLAEQFEVLAPQPGEAE